MQVELSESTNHLLHRLLATGRFANAEEAIAEGLRSQLEEDGYWAELEQSIDESAASIARGGGTVLGPGVGQAIIQRAKDRWDARQ